MANLTSAINVQIDTKTKQEATAILSDLGLSMSTAINLFLKQVIKRDGLPFKVTNPKPTKELLEALQEGEDILSGKIEAKSYHSIKELIEDLENDI